MGEKKLNSGWTRVENEWLEGVITRDLSGSELRVLLCVLRQTAGYNRDSAELSIAAVARLCSMPFGTARKALERLEAAGEIVREQGGSRGCSVVFLSGSTTMPKNGQCTMPKNGQCTMPKLENASLDKESIKKRDTIPSHFLGVAKRYHAAIKRAHPNLSAALTEKADQAGAAVLEKLARIDGYDIDYIKKVLDWAMTDRFWSANLRSLASARNKGKNGSTKFENCAAQYEMASPAPVATGAGRQDGGSIYGHMTDDEMRAYAERIRPSSKAGGKNAGKGWQGL